MKEIRIETSKKINSSEVDPYEHLIIGFINNEIHGVVLQDSRNLYQYNTTSREGATEFFNFATLEDLINAVFKASPKVKFCVVNE